LFSNYNHEPTITISTIYNYNHLYNYKASIEPYEASIEPYEASIEPYEASIEPYEASIEPYMKHL